MEKYESSTSSPNLVSSYVFNCKYGIIAKRVYNFAEYQSSRNGALYVGRLYFHYSPKNMKSGKAIDEKKQRVRSNHCHKEVNGDGTTCSEAPADAKEAFRKEVHERNVAKFSKDLGHLSHSNPATRTGSHVSSGAEPSVQPGVQVPRNGSGKRQRNVAKLSKDLGHLSHSNPARQTGSHVSSGAEPTVRLGVQAPRNGSGKRQRDEAKLSKDMGHHSHSNPATQTGSHVSSDDEPLVRLGVQAPRNGSGKRQRRTGSPLRISEMRRIGKFFFESGLELDAVNLPSFRQMMCASHRNLKTACTLPSCKDLEGWIFEEEWKDMQQYVKKIRTSWTQTGCSILLDHWQGAGGRNMVNILVACPKGTIYLRSADISGYDQDINSMVLLLDEVLREVGVENVVQVITYTTSPWMDEVGESFKKKYSNLFWTVSVSHCVSLMLEEITGVKDTLVKGKVVGWKNSTMSSRQKGKRVAELVDDRCFWDGDKASMPLVCALEFLSESNVPSVAYVYHIMDVVKEKIKTDFKNKRSSYMPFWNAIDGIWNKYLHSPLHAAAAYLNPMLYYNNFYSRDDEVSEGLRYCLLSMPKPEVAKLVFDQVDSYGMIQGAFGLGKDDIQSDVSPASWWHEYGREVPELQRLAIRILSQTCDGAAKFNLKRSLAERFLTEQRNCEEQKRLADLLFVHYNLHLQNFIEHADDRRVVQWMKGMKSWIDMGHSSSHHK